LILLVALAGVTSLGFGSALVYAGSKAGTSRIGVRVVSVRGAAGRTGATMIGKRGVAKTADIPGGSIETVCKGTANGTTYTLTENCGVVTSPITVPSSITTVNGDGHTISATDIGSSQFKAVSPGLDCPFAVRSTRRPSQTRTWCRALLLVVWELVDRDVVRGDIP
jgi:hypothetical protein